MIIIDNFLSQSDFQPIKNTIESPNFPWNYSNLNRAKERQYFKSQYVHLFMSGYGEDSGLQSQYLNILNPIITFLAPEKILRIKCNAGQKTDKVLFCGWHKDWFDKLTYSAIYYVNTNNGYTAFKNGNKIGSVANRLVIFNSNLDHSSATSTNVKRRIVINFVFQASNQTINNLRRYHDLP